MKYAIYGISCCGKDTLIENLLASGKFPGFTHPKGSESLNALARLSYGKTFKELSPQEKDAVRVRYAEDLSGMDNLFADGHYCFPKDGGYDVVFTDADALCYGTFLYLRAKPDMVKERIALSEKNRKFAGLTTAQIDAWQQKEISELRDICFRLNKDFIVLDDDLEGILSFVSYYNANHGIVNCYEQARRLADLCRIYAKESGKIALFDCDRTIIAEDSGALYFKENGASLDPVKELFEGDIYSLYQFDKYYDMCRLGCRFPSSDQFHMNPVIMKKIDELRQQGYFIVAVTSGIGYIWRDLNRERGFADWIIASDPVFGLNICDFTKGFLAKILSRDLQVVACGDSLTDIYMLEAATEGFVYAPGKTRTSVQQYLDSHPHTRIKQFKENPVHYNNIEAV